MTSSSPVFLDANVLIYALDESSEPYATTVASLQSLISEHVTLCTSHHVIEEVLHVIKKLPQSDVTPSQVIEEISQIPDLVMVEPAADLDFARRYAVLSEQLNMGINDALLLQLMIDAGITRLFSYDKKFLARAGTMDIDAV